MAAKPISAKDATNAIGALYKKPITIGDLQASILASHTEVSGITPAKDQAIHDLMYNYLQVNKASLSADQVNSFAAKLAWICCGKELTKLLATVPNASLQEIMETAKKSGFSVKVTG